MTSIQTIRDACGGEGATKVFEAKPISRERFLAVRQLWSSRSERPFAAGAVASTSQAPKQAASKPKMAASSSTLSKRSALLTRSSSRNRLVGTDT